MVIVDHASYKILVSACLLGQSVRYDGGHCLQDDPLWRTWQAENRFIAICPEVAGGLSVPRPAAEVEAGDGPGVLIGERAVLSKSGHDVTDAFLTGAQKALALAQQHGIKMAILKEKSPSCGVLSTYSGQFSGELTANMGVTAALLKANGIAVFSDTRLKDAATYLAALEASDLAE